MPDLIEQLRDYAAYLDELPPDSAATSTSTRAPWRRVAAVAVAVVVAGALVFAVVSRDTGSSPHITTEPPTSASTPSPSTVPTTTLAPAVGSFDNDSLTFEQQVATVERWYRNARAEAPGGRPGLSAEWVFCDTRAVNPNANNVGGNFADYFPLGQDLTEARLVDGCIHVGVPSGTGIIPVETPESALPVHQLCATDRRGPNSDPNDQPIVRPLLRPVVVLGEADCTALGYQDFSPAILDNLNTLRRIEIKLRAVPRACPTEAEATAWVQKVTTEELGHAWTIGPLASAPRTTTGCFLPYIIDWNAERVEFAQFAAP